MTTGTVKTQGTRLFFGVSSSEIHKVACPTGISQLAAPANNVDKTCLDSERSEGEQGMKVWQQLTINVNYIAKSAAHQALERLEDSGEIVPWMEVLSDQVGTPDALDSQGYLVSPGPTTNGFMAYVVSFGTEKAVDDIVRATLVLMPSGPLKRDRATPIYD